MLTKLFFIGFTVLAGFFLIYSCKDKAGVNPICNANDAYNFPVKPGTQEWAQLKTGQEMQNAVQVPPMILSRMSTCGLLETCLTYPLFGNMFASSSSLENGFRGFVVNTFNGFPELFRRLDAGPLILAKYRSIDPRIISADWKNEQKEEFALSLTKLELVLAQSEIISILSQEQRKELMAEALTKYEAIQASTTSFNEYTVHTTCLVMARLLQYDRVEPFISDIAHDEHLRYFLASGVYFPGLAEKVKGYAAYYP